MEEKNKLEGAREHSCKMCEAMSAMHGKMCADGRCGVLIKAIIYFIVLGMILGIGFRLGRLESFSSLGYYRLPINCYMLNR